MTKTSLNPEAALERTLHQLLQRLREVGGENILGFAVLGTPQRPPVALSAGGSATRHRDIHALVVVANASLSALLPLATVLTAAHRQSQVVPMVMTPADLRVEALLFPARLLEIRRQHRLLFGDVHLERLEIPPQGLQFAALQEIRKVESRMRHRVVIQGGDSDMLWKGMQQSLARLDSLLETVVTEGQFMPAPGAGAGGEIRRAAGALLGIEPGRWQPLAGLRSASQRPPDEAVRETLDAYLRLLKELVLGLGRAAAASGLPLTSAATWET